MPKVMGLTAYSIPSAPTAYDIVWVNFPYSENPGEPGPKGRPGLILSVSAHEEAGTKSQYATVQVAYGTSAPQRNPSPLTHFRVHNFIALSRSGLATDTYFRLDRIAKLMWCEEFFPMRQDTGTPIIGRLPHDHILSLLTVKKIRDEGARHSRNG